jgi:predicted AAA+ superfamily ATPase
MKKNSVRSRLKRKSSRRSKPLGKLTKRIGKKELEEIALQRLRATSHDEEQWSFIFRTARPHLRAARGMADSGHLQR